MKKYTIGIPITLNENCTIKKTISSLEKDLLSEEFPKKVETLICLNNHNKFIENNLNSFYLNFLKRLVHEFSHLKGKEYEEKILNTLKGRKKFPEKYKQNILKKMCSIISMEDKIKSIKKEVYNLFKEDTGERRYSYVRRNWIFPNHLDVMSDLSKEMCSKYGGDEQICELAILLHDTGLIYRRESSSPIGHENRSVEYALKIMKKYTLSEEIKNKVIECVKATDTEIEPKILDARIVRSADALSQFVSVHFFAKAAFSGDWESYVNWLKRKVVKNFKKICFEDERKKAEPIKNYILNAIKTYEEKNEKYTKYD